MRFWLAQRLIYAHALLLLLLLTASCATDRIEPRLSASPLTSLRGPGEAQGAIVFFPGYSVWETTFLKNTMRVPYVLADMGGRGWDVFHAEIPGRGNNALKEAASEAAAETVAKLKLNGYKKVVLAGQSGGAWLLLKLGHRSSGADGIILFSPACCGENSTLNTSMFYEAIKYWNNTPIVLIEFANDPYLPLPGRAKSSASILNKSSAPYLMINNPSGLSGHTAGQGWKFAQAFGLCIESFLSNNAVSGLHLCQPQMAQPQDTRWMAYEAELLAAGAKLLSSDTALSSIFNRDLVWYSGAADWRIHVSANHKMTVDFLPIVTADYLSSVEIDWRIDEERLCFELPTHPEPRSICWHVYSSSDGFVHLVGNKGLIEGRSRL